GQEDAQLLHDDIFARFAEAFGSGRSTPRRVPRAGSDSTFNTPPSWLTRSFIPTSPNPRTRLELKPFPSSSTLTRRRFGSWRTTTRTFFAYACFEQLFKASCTILYTHVLCSSGKLSETFSSTVSTSIPVRLDTPRACQSSAATRPRSSNIEGRSSKAILRTSLTQFSASVLIF